MDTRCKASPCTATRSPWPWAGNSGRPSQAKTDRGTGRPGFASATPLRQRHGVDDRVLADFCLHCWCHPCALCQEARALKLLGTDGKLGGDSGKVSPARMEMTTAPNHNAGVATQLTI